jgi:hypothetical protein
LDGEIGGVDEISGGGISAVDVTTGGTASRVVERGSGVDVDIDDRLGPWLWPGIGTDGTTGAGGLMAEVGASLVLVEDESRVIDEGNTVVYSVAVTMIVIAVSEPKAPEGWLALGSTLVGIGACDGGRRLEDASETTTPVVEGEIPAADEEAGWSGLIDGRLGSWLSGAGEAVAEMGWLLGIWLSRVAEVVAEKSWLLGVWLSRVGEVVAESSWLFEAWLEFEKALVEDSWALEPIAPELRGFAPGKENPPLLPPPEDPPVVTGLAPVAKEEETEGAVAELSVKEAGWVGAELSAWTVVTGKVDAASVLLSSGWYVDVGASNAVELGISVWVWEETPSMALDWGVEETTVALAWLSELIDVDGVGVTSGGGTLGICVKNDVWMIVCSESSPAGWPFGNWKLTAGSVSVARMGWIGVTIMPTDSALTPSVTRLGTSDDGTEAIKELVGLVSRMAVGVGVVDIDESKVGEAMNELFANEERLYEISTCYSLCLVTVPTYGCLLWRWGTGPAITIVKEAASSHEAK